MTRSSHFLCRSNPPQQKKIEDQFDKFHEEVEKAKYFGGRSMIQGCHAVSTIGHHKDNFLGESALVKRKNMLDTGVNGHSDSPLVCSGVHIQNLSWESAANAYAESIDSPNETDVVVLHNQEQDDTLFDTYISTKSFQSSVNMKHSAKSNMFISAKEDQIRDDSEAIDTSYHLQSHVYGTLGGLTKEQTLVLESLDLSGNKNEILEMLGKVPGLTKNQLHLLVDVAYSLVA